MNTHRNFEIKVHFILLIILLLLTALSASAQTIYTWVGPNGNGLTGGAWGTAANWSPAGPPASGSNSIVVFNGGATFTVTGVTAQNIKQLLVTNNSNISLDAPSSATLTLQGAASTDNLVIASGSLLSLTNVNVSFSSSFGSQKGDISGTLEVRSGARLTTNNASTFRVTVKTGGVVNHYTNGNFTTDANTFSFDSAATYENKATGNFTIPTSTWHTASNVKVTGIQSGTPGGLVQNFGNFLWDAAGQTADVTPTGTGFPTNVRGTFEVRNTNGFFFTLLNNTSSTNYTWAGDLLISGGRLAYRTNSGVATSLTVRNFTLDNTSNNKAQFSLQNSSSYDIDFTANGNTVLTLGQNSAYTNIIELQTRGNIYLKGNLTQTGTGAGKIGRTGTPTTSFNFLGTGTQTVTLARTDLFGAFSNLNFSTTGTVEVGANTIAPTTALYNIAAGTTVNISSGNIGAGGNFTLDGTLNIGTGNVSNAGTFTASSGSTLVLATGKINNTGNFTLSSGATISIGSPQGIVAGNDPSPLSGNIQNGTTTRSFNAGANYIYTGDDGQVTGSGLPTANITGTFTVNLSAASAKLSPTNNISLSKNGVALNLTRGVLTLNDKYIALSSVTGLTRGSANSFVATNNTGDFRKAFATGSNVLFTYPLGDVTGTLEYSPVALTLTGVNTGGGNLGVRVTDADHPNKGSLNVISRYWSFTTLTGLTAYNYTAEFTNLGADGTSDNAIRYTGSSTNWATIGATGGTIPFTVSSNLATYPLTSDFTATTACTTLGEWTGALSNAWENAGNWSCNTLPASTTDVTIPNVTNKPTVPVAGSSVNNITIADGVTVTLNGSLQVNGNVIGGSSANVVFAGSAELVLNGGAGQTITGKVLAEKLTINNTGPGVTALNIADIKVNAALVLTKGNFTNNGNVTLLSTAAGTAYLDNFTSNTAGAYAGNLTVQRFLSNVNDGYRDLSSPVNTTVADWAADFSVFGQDSVNTWYTYNPYPNLQQYIESDNTATSDYYGGYFSYTGTNRPLTPLKGFAARIYNANTPLPFTIDLTGAPYNDAQSIAITKTTTATPAADGWNLIGNPYPSPILWTRARTLNAGRTDGSYYAFQTSGEYAGTWGTFNGTTGTNGATDVIASSQGFFVRASGNNNFELNNTVREAAYTAPFYKTEQLQPDEIRLKLGTNTLGDEVVAYTDANTTFGYDAGYDALKIPAGSTIYLSYETQGNEYAINVVNSINLQTEFPLVLWVADTGNYTFAATALNLTGLTPYLKDAQTNTFYDLTTTNPVLTLNGNYSYRNRYYIVFQNVVSGTPQVAAAQPKVYAAGNRIIVARNNQAPAQISVQNILGQQLEAFTSNNEFNEIEMKQNTGAWYAIVRIAEGDKITVKKLLLNAK